jgi:hypothetical protein
VINFITYRILGTLIQVKRKGSDRPRLTSAADR